MEFTSIEGVRGSQDRKLFGLPDGSFLTGIYWASYGGVKVFRSDADGNIRDWAALFYDRYTQDQEIAVRNFLGEAA